MWQYKVCKVGSLFVNLNHFKFNCFLICTFIIASENHYFLAWIAEFLLLCDLQNQTD